MIALIIAIEIACATVFLVWSIRTGRNNLAVRVARMECHIWKDLYSLLRREIHVPAGSTPLSSSRGWWQLPAMITGATLIEFVAVELLVPWRWLRLTLVVISLYSLVWLWGYFAQKVVHPHYLGDKLVLRDGRKVLLTIPHTEIDSIRKVRRFETGRKSTESELIIEGTEGTNVELRSPRMKISLWFDDPERLRR